MANMKEMWDDMESAGTRIGGEKRQFRDFQPPDYDPRQRRRTDDAGFPQQQVHPLKSYPYFSYCASFVSVASSDRQQSCHRQTYF